MSITNGAPVGTAREFCGDDAAEPTDRPFAELCVLASGSSGNCSALVIGRGRRRPDARPAFRRVCLIDLGLSPRRTAKLLAEHGLGLHDVDDAVLTHLDHDHFHHGWFKAFPRHARLRLPAPHARRGLGAEIASLCGLQGQGFDDGFELRSGAGVRAVLMAHDNEGAAAFRFDIPGCGSLGFATDLGRVTHPLVDAFAGVEVLAIESNYCPRLQAGSGRPIFLQRRITDGAGHLSNEEAAEATRRIGPREHVVLLHLSRQCNDPALATSFHAGARYRLTVSSQYSPTPWVPIGADVNADLQVRSVDPATPSIEFSR